MPGWTLVDTHPAHGRTFRRPLDPLELCYLSDGFFNGTSDSAHHYELRLPNGVRDAHLFAKENIIHAWLSTKRRFPLVGAAARGADGCALRLGEATDPDTDTGAGFASEPHFVVREHDLSILRSHEIVFGCVDSADDAQQKAARIVHGPRPLSEEFLVRLYVFRETGAERTDVLHLVILLAHCVTDGTASRTLVRCLLDTLARGGELEPAQVALEERLAMAIPPMDLEPLHLRSLSPAIRRWRRAVGAVICQSRTARRQGGHTLPCRLKSTTVHDAARPSLFSTLLTPTQSATVIANCHLHGITLGHAYLVLAQVAMTRVLYRRYLRGEISEEEWAYRKRQPHINGGPLNLRRYLDDTWFDSGGGGEFVLCISLYMYQLPFMTLGKQRVSSDGAPPFSDLLTDERFLLRARLVKKQAAAFFNHPLFLEIVHATHWEYLQFTRFRALRWMRQRTQTANGQVTQRDVDEDKILAVTDIPSIWAHGGSTLGNLDLISPSEYPLPAIHPLSPYSSSTHPVRTGYVTPLSRPSDPETDTTPSIVVENSKVHLHTRPAELYLGAATSRGRMNMYVQYDGNVFEDDVVKEWLDEVRKAVLWYLDRAS